MHVELYLKKKLNEKLISRLVFLFFHQVIVRKIVKSVWVEKQMKMLSWHKFPFSKCFNCTSFAYVFQILAEKIGIENMVIENVWRICVLNLMFEDE